MKAYKIVANYQDFLDMVDYIDDYDLLAYDTETTGLNVRKDRIIGFSICGLEDTGFYFPIYKWNGEDLVYVLDFFNHDVLESIFTKLLQKKLIMHNASFDIRMTVNDLKQDFDNVINALHCDTIVLKHTVDEERPFGLKQIAKKIQHEINFNVDDVANKEQVELLESIKANGGSTSRESYELFKADLDKIGIYACADTDLTFRVYKYYLDKLQDQGLSDFFFKDEVMPLLREVTIPMEHRGIPVDSDLLMQTRACILTDIQSLEDSIQELIKPYLNPFERWFLNKDMPPKRSGQFAQYVCKYAKLELPKTKSGNFSVAKANLDKLESKLVKNKYIKFLQGGPHLPEEDVLNIQRLWWQDQEKRYMFNITSNYHLGKLFFEGLGEDPMFYTEKGNAQINDYYLQEMAKKYEFAKLIVDYKKLNKIKSTYIDRFLDHQMDGMFYPSFHQHRTISGRYGSDMQQLPRPKEPGQLSELVLKYNNLVRKFFISGDDHVFIDNDYESLEPHVFAHVSGDPGLIDIFNKGHDFYSTIAIRTEGLQGVSADKKADNYLGNVNKPLRQKAKSYSLGIPYGMEAFKLSKELDISQSEAERLVNDYLNSFPKLKEWMEWSKDQCINKGYVKSEAGRVRHMETAKKIYYSYGEDLLDSLKVWQTYQHSPKKYDQMKYLRKQLRNYLNNAKNFQIQSLAASIVNRAAIKINRELKRQGIDGYVCLQIHDQLVVRVPSEHAEKCRNLVQYIMENNYKLSVELKAPAEISNNLLEGH